MIKVDLNSPEYTKLFAEAPVYVKKAIVTAVQVTREGLAYDEYREKGVVMNDQGLHEMPTYVMEEVNGVRQKTWETTHGVDVGMWIVTNPKAFPTDCENNYVMDDENFHKKYEPTDQEGVYRAKGQVRIIPNTTGDIVVINPSWGGEQKSKKANCYFCVAYDPAHPDELSNDRYILDEEFFQLYILASELAK